MSADELTESAELAELAAPRFGAKLERLLRLRATPSLRELVPPVHPVAALAPGGFDPEGSTDAAVAAYAAALRSAHPGLAAAVRETCGPAPWIVRSAGIEDLDELVNAGGYDSLVCDAPEALERRIAEVALSGLGERSTRQRALAGDTDAARPIACFVQPLLPLEVDAQVHCRDVPLIDDAVLARMESIAVVAMDLFGFDAVDAEWGLSTDRGFVSVTTLMPRDTASAHVSHTLGFGFASAQTSGSRPTALALRPAGSPLRLWRGEGLRTVDVRGLHLLQARPTRLDAALQPRESLTPESRGSLSAQYASQSASVLTLGARIHGRALVAPDLATAWRHYLGLDAAARAAVAVVLVDEGNAEEHAGLMFRQARVTCVRTATARVPAGTEIVVMDSGRCFLGDAAMARAIVTVSRPEFVLPDGCARLFPADVGTVTGLDGADDSAALRDLAALPLSADARARLIARSVWPEADLWRTSADGAVESPSLLARCLRSGETGSPVPGGLAGPMPAFAAAYVQATRLSRGEAALPALPAGHSADHHDAHNVRADLDALASLTRHSDLRLPLGVLDWTHARAWLPNDLALELLRTAATRASVRDNDTAATVLGLATQVDADNRGLPLNDGEESVALVSALASAFADGLSAERFDALRALGLPLGSVAELAAGLRDPGSLIAVMAFHDAVAAFRSVVGGGDADALATALDRAWRDLRAALTATAKAPVAAPVAAPSLAHLAEQLRGTLIETYDASLKALLGHTIESRDDAAYRRYLAVMRHWIDFLEPSADSARDRTVLDRFRGWLSAWEAEALPGSFEIEDRNWSVVFELVAAPDREVERYENPHVLHNLLHQWSLAGLHIDSARLPRRVRALEQFCATFSSRSTKVLRHEHELLEIQIPMGTHKASYVFTPRQVTVEWTEPPDCPGDEIARILAYEILLARLRDWMFPTLTVRRERILGTWTLFIRLRADGVDGVDGVGGVGGVADEAANGAAPGGGWRIETLHRFVAATRLLFDASYDFSYVDNDAVDGLDADLRRPEWPEIFERLVAYRSVLEDAAQYVALHALPLSSTVSAIAQSGVVRSLFRRCLSRGPEAGLRLVDALAASLDHLDDSPRWRQRYEHLRQACLAMSALWPEEAFAALAARPARDADSHAHADVGAAPVADQLLAACLFCRADLRAALHALARAQGPSLAGVRGLIVRHAPEIALDAWGADALAGLLRATGARWRRGKHFVLAHAADRLAPDVLAALLTELDSVPHGLTPPAEAAIDAALAARGPRLRFALARGVDWAGLAGAAESGDDHDHDHDHDHDDEDEDDDSDT